MSREAIARPGRILTMVAAGVLLAVPLLAGPVERAQAFALVFVSIVLEAWPFMLLGSLVGGLIEVYVPREALLARLPRNALGAACLAAAFGLVLPVCECAVVPVVRRLVRKGLPLSAAVAFLLGAPIVNPLVGLSTWMAYGFDLKMAALRLAAGFGIAVGVALLMKRLFASHSALLMDLQPPGAATGDCSCAHGASRRGWQRLGAVARHASDDFLAVAHYLVLGAALAAAAQIALDRRAILAFGDRPLGSTAAMMALAVLLNLCSEADAFVAASFRGLLPLPAQMAFMLTGPMLDIKLLLMYRTLFTRRARWILPALVLLAVAVVGWVLHAVAWGRP